MSFLVDARDDLFEALSSSEFVEPIDGWQFADRVFRTRPPQLVAPSVYIGSSEGVERTTPSGRATVYVARFPVVVIYDGAQAKQVGGVDELVGRVHDAVQMSPCEGRMVAHTNQPPPDMGGNLTSTTRAAVCEVEVTTRARTFRSPTPVEAPSG